MGLNSDIDTAIKRAFETDLADAVKPLIYYQETRGGYDPTTGQVVPTEKLEATSRGVFDEAIQVEVLNSNIEPLTIKVIILQSELSINPRIGDDMVAESNTYRVNAVEADPADVIYELHVKRVSP